jgi:hypothetical protein
MVREYTNRLLELIEEGVLDKDTVITACVKYMSESEVKDLCHTNEFFDLDQEIEDEEDSDLILEDFNYVGSRHHY